MIKIYTFQFNNASFLEQQAVTFKRFMTQPFELICINNAFDKHHEKIAIERKAAELGIRHYYPQGVVHNKGAGRSHQLALNWCFKTLVLPTDDLTILLDHDMYLIREPNLFPEYDIAGIMQGRGEHIRYLHPGFLIIHPGLKDREMIDFIGEEIDGLACDSGGNLHHYLKAHPDLKIKGMSMVNICYEQGNMEVLPEQARVGYSQDIPMQICEDFMLHGLALSNWANTEQSKFARKKEQVNMTINHYMSL